MSCFLTFQTPKALPSLIPQPKRKSLAFSSTHNKHFHNNTHLDKKAKSISRKAGDCYFAKKHNLAIQLGALLATVEQPAFAVTGVNNQEDLIWVLVQLAIVAFFYFIVMPPIIMNWLRIRWYRRKLLEMYLQFMFVFIFFPGILLWAPFLNFRKFPRDPTMKYPWSTPENPSQLKNSFLKYPFASPEDYD